MLLSSLTGESVYEMSLLVCLYGRGRYVDDGVMQVGQPCESIRRQVRFGGWVIKQLAEDCINMLQITLSWGLHSLLYRLRDLGEYILDMCEVCVGILILDISRWDVEGKRRRVKQKRSVVGYVGFSGKRHVKLCGVVYNQRGWPLENYGRVPRWR